MPFWEWYVTLTKTPCMVLDDNGDCLTTCCDYLFCSPCKITYCLCGKDKNDRVTCCSELFEKMDQSSYNIFCCPCWCIEQQQQHRLQIVQMKQEHELNMLKLKSSSAPTTQVMNNE
jgi:hypothetical protein